MKITLLDTFVAVVGIFCIVGFVMLAVAIPRSERAAYERQRPEMERRAKIDAQNEANCVARGKAVTRIHGGKLCYKPIRKANIWNWCAECLARLPFWPQ